ncbi:hypothetical protein D6827_03120, partial [Candidatus Parcubacteria bacterium]
MNTFKNLTPHAINIGNIVIPPSGQIARVATFRNHFGEIDGIPITVSKMSDLEGIPDEPGNYIVSRIVGEQAAKLPNYFVLVTFTDNGKT